MVPLLCPARKYILFDLDGTLLPMDMPEYLRIYIAGLAAQIPHIPAEQMHGVLWEGILAMMKNDGSRTNRAAFADVFTARTGLDYDENEEKFLRFYETDYQKCAAACTPVPLAARLIGTLQKKGYRIVIATSPLYPACATQSRLRWAGLDGCDFPLVTTFDDFHHAKPHPGYYLEVCEKLGAAPQDCLMVGNDVEEDGVAQSIGIETLLVTDCLINKKSLPTEAFRLASLQDVMTWAECLPALV